MSQAPSASREPAPASRPDPRAIVVVPGLSTVVTTFQRVQAVQRLHRRIPVNGWLGLVLGLVLSPALFAYMQSGLNSAWSAAARHH